MRKREPLIDLLIHDLTGPISIVLTSAKNLLTKKEKYGTTDKQIEILERIYRNSNKAKALLHELVEVYRSEEGRFSKQSLSLTDVVRESLLDAYEIIDPGKAQSLLSCTTNDEFFKTLRAGHIVITMSGKFADAPFLHDYQKIRQILRNLISNALKHRRKGLVLVVDGDSDLIISVSDDGLGLSKEEQATIFNRFADLKDKTIIPSQGLGFGLSCVKTLVEAIGGEITVKSGEGEGTCFTVRIPQLSETQS